MFLFQVNKMNNHNNDLGELIHLLYEIRDMKKDIKDYRIKEIFIELEERVTKEINQINREQKGIFFFDYNRYENNIKNFQKGNDL